MADEQRTLECILTQEELLARGDEQAAAELEIERLSMQRKGLNGEIASLRERRNKLAHTVDTKREVRAVACRWEPDYAKAVTRCVRLDTGEMIEERTLSSEELQVEIFDGEEELAATPAPAPPARRTRRARAPVHHEHVSQ